jgi:predicted anti-sigma-YlaC factor YlaD
MNDKHILEILDEKRFIELGEDDLETIQNHSAECSSCNSAFEAARISAVLLDIRAENPAIEPSPFFQAKMMNALRAKQNLRKPFAAFRRWWQASSILVGSMLLLVFAFVALTFLAPKSKTDEAVSTYNLYSTDSVILNQKPRNLTTEQTLEVIYNERKDSVKR